MDHEQIDLDFEESNIYSVSELMLGIKTNLEDIYFDITVEGEITSFKHHSSGHYYFSLSDDKAKIDAVMFRQQNIYLTFKPEEGVQVRARGKVTVYEPQGRMQFQVIAMEETGKGTALEAFRKLAEKLSKEGLFDTKHKKKLPEVPKRIGLITSPTGAAIRDFREVTSARFAGLEIILFPTHVQGDSAIKEIIDALDYVDNRVKPDVIVITRGGGSPEDLAIFNDEDLARAVFKAKTPVISAIGHQIDTTILDFVADISAPTPSAAAEMIIEKKSVLNDQLVNLQERLKKQMLGNLEMQRLTLKSYLARSIFRDPFSMLSDYAQKLDMVSERLQYKFSAFLEEMKHSLEKNVALLKTLNPENVLERGYSITMFEGGDKVISSGFDVKAGETIRTVFKESILDSVAGKAAKREDRTRE
ncbi:MAG: exodeoxyribonuclease VII large subunit [Acidobacteria bacterium]|nr:exodeoxyribonuclease VII large subunit [Acidobacteriota bacterium]